jgi:signal transduction histidine kinase
MLSTFLEANREQLISRCREKVAKRPSPRPSDRELRYGIPLFLDQLIEALRREHAEGPSQTTAFLALSDVQTTPRDSDIGRGAAQHGNELLRTGFTVDQVVHDYGDLCQAVTEMAVEQNATVTTEEFRTLNRCLDEAIADAVTEFGRQRDQFFADEAARVMNERLGFFAHELRNLVHTAMLSAAAIKKGTVGFAGATGAVHERSLMALRDLIDRTLVEVRLTAGIPERRERIKVAEFIEDVQIGASLDAMDRGLELVVSVPQGLLAIDADRQILAGAVSNLLQNALKFTRPSGRISLKAYSAADRILIEVEDECGGLPPGKAEAMFRPFEQLDAERTGLGLGLTISRRGVEANGGKLTVRDLPGKGCVFIVDLPRPSPPPLAGPPLAQAPVIR